MYGVGWEGGRVPREKKEKEASKNKMRTLKKKRKLEKRY